MAMFYGKKNVALVMHLIVFIICSCKIKYDNQFFRLFRELVNVN